MKQFAIGCAGMILGLIVGVILVLSATAFLNLGASSMAIPTPDPRLPDVTVNVTAAFVNTQLQQAVRQSNLARQANVSLAAPNIVRVALTTDVTVAGKALSVDATVTMRVAAQNGRIVLTIEKIDAGGMTLPVTFATQTVERLRAQMEDQLNRLVTRALQGLTLKLINLSVAPDGVTLGFK